MHILWSAAEPQLEGNGGLPNSKIKDLWNDHSLVLMYHGAVKATQGHSGTQLKREGRGELHYQFQWLNSEQNWNLYVLSFVSFFHSHFPSLGQHSLQYVPELKRYLFLLYSYGRTQKYCKQVFCIYQELNTVQHTFKHALSPLGFIHLVSFFCPESSSSCLIMAPLCGETKKLRVGLEKKKIKPAEYNAGKLKKGIYISSVREPHLTVFILHNNASW